MAAKPELVIKTMRQNGIKFFDVYDADLRRQTEQMQNIPAEAALERLQEFLDEAGHGLYWVNLYKTNERKANGEPKNPTFSYEVYTEDKPKKVAEPEPVSAPPVPEYGIMGRGVQEPLQQVFTQGGMIGGVGLDQYLNEKNTILELRLQIQKLEMENKYLQDKMERREAELRAEMDKQASSENRIQGIIGQVLPAFMQGFAGQSPMNGITQPQPDMQNQVQNQEKQTVINAVNRLMQLDPNFAKNISALAVLAEKKPDMYSMAVQYLNNL
jgi:hypothetical protein